MNLDLKPHESGGLLAELIDGYPSLDVEMSPVERQRKFRAWVTRLEAFIAEYPQLLVPVEHYYHEGRYAREALFPVDSIIIGRIHNHAHRCLVMGHCIVVSEHEIREIDGVDEFDSFPGAKRVILNLSEVRWSTIHTVGDVPYDQIESHLVSKSFESFDRMSSQPVLLGEAS